MTFKKDMRVRRVKLVRSDIIYRLVKHTYHDIQRGIYVSFIIVISWVRFFKIWLLGVCIYVSFK